jgi:putative membrane protein
MTIPKIFGASGAAALILCGTLASASAAVSSQDQSFATQAAQAGMAEVADAKLALSKNPPPQAKAVAQRMIADHTNANDKLMSIAQAQGIKLPSGPGPMDQVTMLKEKVLSGGTFASTYLHDQQGDHKKAIALFQKEAAEGKDPQLVAFAKATLPTLQSHLAMVDGALNSKM